MTLHPWRRAKTLQVSGEAVRSTPVWHCFCGVTLRATDDTSEASAYEACGCLVLTGGFDHLEDLRNWLSSTVWRPETSADPPGWCGHRPSHGQGAVTALEVQRLYGGVLLQALNDGIMHLWNRLADGTEVDLTRDQFDEWRPCGQTVVRDRRDVLADPGTARRYDLVLAVITRRRAA